MVIIQGSRDQAVDGLLPLGSNLLLRAASELGHDVPLVGLERFLVHLGSLLALWNSPLLPTVV